MYVVQFLADNERNNTMSGGGGGGGSASKASNSNNSDSSGLRRACSLSDLSKPGGAAQRRILPSTPNNGNYAKYLLGLF